MGGCARPQKTQVLPQASAGQVNPGSPGVFNVDPPKPPFFSHPPPPIRPPASPSPVPLPCLFSWGLGGCGWVSGLGCGCELGVCLWCLGLGGVVGPPSPLCEGCVAHAGSRILPDLLILQGFVNSSLLRRSGPRVDPTQFFLQALLGLGHRLGPGGWGPPNPVCGGSTRGKQTPSKFIDFEWSRQCLRSARIHLGSTTIHSDSTSIDKNPYTIRQNPLE